MNHEAVLSFEYPTAALAQRVASAIGPELNDIEDDRSRVTSHVEDSMLEIRVEAADLVALRAAMNTWLSLVSVAEQTGTSS